MWLFRDKIPKQPANIPKENNFNTELSSTSHVKITKPKTSYLYWRLELATDLLLLS